MSSFDFHERYQCNAKGIIIPREIEAMPIPVIESFGIHTIPAGFTYQGDEVKYEVVINNQARGLYRPDKITCLISAFTAKSKTSLGIRDFAIDEQKVSWGNMAIWQYGNMAIWKRWHNIPEEITSQFAISDPEYPGIPSPELRLNEGSHSFYVAKHARRKGIGKHLFIAGLAIARKLGATEHIIMLREDGTYRRDIHRATDQNPAEFSFYGQFTSLTAGWAWVFPLCANPINA